MKYALTILIIFYSLISDAQVTSRCPVCPPSLNGVTTGWVLTDSAGFARWQAGGIGSLSAEQGLNKVGSAVRLGGELNRGNATIQLGTNQLIFANDSTFPTNNTQAFVFNSGDGAAYNGSTFSDSLNTSFLHSNTSIEQSITSNFTGLNTLALQDSARIQMSVKYNGLNWQVGVYDNEGTKGNFTTEFNVFSPPLDRDIEFLGLHYGHWQYFITDTLSGASQFPQGHGVFAMDSFVMANHVTEKPVSEYASKYASKFLFDTAQTLLFDSGAANIKTFYHNDTLRITSNKPIKIGTGSLIVGTDGSVMASTGISVIGKTVTPPQYATPTTGTTVTSNGNSQLVVNPAGTLLALTIAFPSSPIDGQQFNIASTQILTGLTLTSGATILGTLTTLAAANGFAGWVYSSTASSWIRTR